MIVVAAQRKKRLILGDHILPNWNQKRGKKLARAKVSPVARPGDKTKNQAPQIIAAPAAGEPQA